MTGSGAIAVSGDGGLRFGRSAAVTADRATAGAEPEFRREWRRFLADVDAHRSVTDVAELLDDDLLVRASEIASDYPGFLSASEAPFGRNRDMVAHVRDHFDSLFNDDSVATAFKPSPEAVDVEALLKASELLYLDDAVTRFTTETVFDPEPDGLERVAFYELPAETSEWMMEVELLIRSLDNRPDDVRHGKDLIESLYDRRRRFVERAVDVDLFLPVPAASDVSREEKRRTIETCVRRGADVDPADVHAYCYSRALELA